MDGKATVWFRARGLCRACSRFCRRAKLRSPEICNPQRCRTDGRAGSKCEQAFVPSLSLSDHFKWRRDSPSQDTPGLACSSSGTWHMNQPPVFRPLKRDRRRIGFHQNGILGAGKKPTQINRCLCNDVLPHIPQGPLEAQKPVCMSACPLVSSDMGPVK